MSNNKYLEKIAARSPSSHGNDVHGNRDVRTAADVEENRKLYETARDRRAKRLQQVGQLKKEPHLKLRQAGIIVGAIGLGAAIKALTKKKNEDK